MRQPIRILVVDDDDSDRDQLVRALGGAGYRVSDSQTAADAVRRSGTFLPDLVVLEMVLGNGFRGTELARLLRAARNPLLIFTTRNRRLTDRLAAFDAGADDYVIKPYVMEELLARVRAALRRAGIRESQVRQVGHLVVDEIAHRASYDGETLELGRTDFALLVELARNTGQVMSKSQLLELVWGYDAVDENLVEVHVSSIRRRLGKPAAELIRTVRGVGYILRDEQPVGELVRGA